MEVVIKAKFNASKEKIEKFGQNKYLIYLPFPEDQESGNILANILSRQLGVPPNRVVYKGKDSNKDFTFLLN